MFTNRLSNLVVAAALVMLIAFAVQRALATKNIAPDTQAGNTQSTGDAARDYRLEDRYDYMSQAPNAQATRDAFHDYRLEDRYDYMSQDPADRFAGTWSGTMSFTDDANRKEDILVTIRAGCTEGGVCGDLNNTTVSCTWEMTLGKINGDVFEYKFSKTMSGECPALGGGTLILQPDGTLMREHKTPNFTASGVLTKR